MSVPLSVIIHALLINRGVLSDPEGDLDWKGFYGYMPDGPQVGNNIGTVVDSSGTKQGRLMVSGEVMERHGFQITLRAQDYQEGISKGRKIEEVLDTFYNELIDVNGDIIVKVHSVTRTSSILFLGFEEKSQRALFSINGLATIDFSYSLKAGDDLHNLIHITFPQTTPAD